VILPLLRICKVVSKALQSINRFKLKEFSENFAIAAKATVKEQLN
jgi:hypothetical protein